jgi:hypothetical protein
MVDHLFLSYRRSPETTPVVERFYNRARVQLAGVTTFFDKKSIDAGEQWEPTIDAFLDKTSLFAAFVSVDFWLSEQCKRELEMALARYEQTQPARPRMLFILADALKPSDLTLDAPAATDAPAPMDVAQASAALEKLGEAAPSFKRIRHLGQFNFLGPYDEGGRLVPLAIGQPQKLDSQLAAMIETIKGLRSEPPAKH